MDINITLGQKQVLSQKMKFSVTILQMNSADLEQFIRGETLENPVIEFEESFDEPLPDKYDKFKWLMSMDESNRVQNAYSSSYEWDSPTFNDDRVNELAHELTAQIPGLGLDEKTESVLRILISSLDNNGYLPPFEPATLVFSKELFDKAHQALTQMDPPGVGAFNLRECLLIQAKRQSNPSLLLIKIIDKHLEHLAKNQLDKIAKALVVTVDEVKAAKMLLLQLNPKPGNGFSVGNHIPYIRPDLYVTHDDEGFHITSNNLNHSRITIGEHYHALTQSNDEQVKRFVTDKIGRAQWLINCVENRKRTIYACAEKILIWQEEFFKKGPGYLVPMTQADIADQLGIHPSTVSRAATGKYLQCQWGVFELSYFFTRHLGQNNQGQSQDALYAELKRIFDNEDKSNPLSDQLVLLELKKSGIIIARRTVAKYRVKMQIPSASKRRGF